MESLKVRTSFDKKRCKDPLKDFESDVIIRVLKTCYLEKLSLDFLALEKRLKYENLRTRRLLEGLNEVINVC